MALRYNGNNIKVVKYNGNDVKKIIVGDSVAWTKSYSVSIAQTSLTGVSDFFLATSATATSGSTTGDYAHGTTVYVIAKVSELNVSKYIRPATWKYKQKVGNYSYFQIASQTLSSDSSSISISVSGMTAKSSYYAAFGGEGVKWSIVSHIDSNYTVGDSFESDDFLVYKGDTLSKINGDSVVCSYTNALGESATRFELHANLAPNTAEYSYSLPINITLSATSVTNANIIVNAVSTISTRSYKVYCETPTGASAAYTATSEATSGHASGYSYPYGTLVHYIVKVSTSSGYSVPSSWGSPFHSQGTSQGTFYWYCVAERTITEETTFNASLSAKEITLTFDTSNMVWKNSSGTIIDTKSAYYNDTVSGTGSSNKITVTCKNPSGSTRWTVTGTVRTDDPNYTYTGTPSITSFTVTTGKYISVSGLTATNKPGSITLLGTGVTWDESILYPTTGRCRLTLGGNPTLVLKDENGRVIRSVSYDLNTGYTLTTAPPSFTITNGIGESYYLDGNDYTGTWSSSGLIDLMGSCTVTLHTKTISGTLIAPASITMSSRVNSANTIGYYSASVKNSNSVPVTAHITWLDGETMSPVYEDSTFTINANSTNSKQISTTTLESIYSVDPEFGLAARVYFSNSDYYDSTSKDSTPQAAPAMRYNPTVITGSSTFRAQIMVGNNNSHAVTAWVTWYDADFDSYISSTSATVEDTSNTLIDGPVFSSLHDSGQGGVYAKVHFMTDLHYPSSVVTSSVCYPPIETPTLSAPVVTSTTNGNITWSDTNVTYNYYTDITVKNNNSVRVELGTSTYNCNHEANKTNTTIYINANSTKTIRVYYNKTYTSYIKLWCNASGYTASDILQVDIYNPSSGGGQT